WSGPSRQILGPIAAHERRSQKRSPCPLGIENIAEGSLERSLLMDQAPRIIVGQRPTVLRQAVEVRSVAQECCANLLGEFVTDLAQMRTDDGVLPEFREFSLVDRSRCAACANQHPIEQRSIPQRA